MKCIEKVRKIGPTLYLPVKKPVALDQGIEEGDIVEFEIINVNKKEKERWGTWTY